MFRACPHHVSLRLYTLLSKAGIGQRVARGVQRKCMKALTLGLARVSALDYRIGVHDIPRIHGWRQYLKWLNAAVSGVLALETFLLLYSPSAVWHLMLCGSNQNQSTLVQG